MLTILVLFGKFLRVNEPAPTDNSTLVAETDFLILVPPLLLETISPMSISLLRANSIFR